MLPGLGDESEFQALFTVTVISILDNLFLFLLQLPGTAAC